MGRHGLFIQSRRLVRRSLVSDSLNISREPALQLDRSMMRGLTCAEIKPHLTQVVFPGDPVGGMPDHHSSKCHPVRVARRCPAASGCLGFRSAGRIAAEACQAYRPVPGDPDLMVHCVDLGARASAWPAKLRAWLAWLVTAREPSLILLDMVPRSLGGPKPVTNPVTTTADRASHSEPVLKSNPHLTWAGSTKADHARRIRQAWHARGQGFESP